MDYNTLFSHLQAAGVHFIMAYYDGEDGEGGVSEIELEDDSDALSELRLSSNQRRLLTNLFEEFLLENFGTWQESEGVRGTIRFELSTGKAVVIHGIVKKTYDDTQLEVEWNPAKNEFTKS